MPHVAAAVAALDPAALREGREVGLNLDGHEHRIGPEDVQLVLQPLEGYQVERSGTHAVALDLELDDELRREALAREIVHAVQAARKGAGLRVEDRIALTLGGDDALLEAARAHEDYVTGETLAVELVYDGADAGTRTEVEGLELVVGVERDGRLARPMHLPPAFEERPFALQLVGLVVVPVIFGLLTGFALGWSEVVYLIMVGPIALHRRVPGRHRAPRRRGRRSSAAWSAGSCSAASSCSATRSPAPRPKAELPDPQVVLVILTTVVGGILGGLGGRFRARRETRAAACRAGAAG